MPMYEYRCRGCGNESEQLILRGSAEPSCPACESEDLEKLISASAVASASTRKRALRGAQKRTAKQRHDRQYEEHKIAHQHSD